MGEKFKFEIFKLRRSIMESSSRSAVSLELFHQIQVEKKNLETVNSNLII